ncbi:MAG TPA: flavodoxin [Candidatus Anaerotignum merdipullorum]|nr:flavodoxin [Candidatus Anaerotignum merdipullorum]
MKRMISVLLACCMMAAVTGCGTSEEAVQNQTQAEKEQQENVQNPSENENAQTDGKTLVVYYSATGNTETVAGYLADALGADLFEITPVQPYTADDLNWSDDTSRVSREHEDASLRTVELEQDTVEHWEEYDTVFIGYPIWWGIAAWPVDGFVTANDFTDKTVIPFCTSSSSDLGESGELLAEMAGTGDWQEGMRFRSGASAEDVQGWLESLEQ